MKNYSLFKYTLIFCLVFLQVQLMAQVNVSIQILPPYPTKFTDYASKPHLMVISITNTSTTNQKIQLRGTVTGDNGIVIRVKPGYKSSNPIELGAGQSRMLNGNDIAYFFDYNQLEYAGITQNEFINKGGLPEGRYQLCIRAFDYDNNTPISAEEPAGCSNSFSISSLEPPIILSPRDEEVISSDAGQIIPLRWNTPVGTPPAIQYRIRMVEILGNKNPNDAMMTARQPYFYDKEVMTNMEIFNPASPQLTPGRKYAMMVQAFDPSNNAVFRNQGKSEVISFTYGSQSKIVEAKPTDTKQGPKKPMTTNTIRGKALWAFKATEENYGGAFAIGGNSMPIVYGNSILDGIKMPEKFATGGLPQLNLAKDSAPITNNVNKNTGVIGGVVFNAFNPLNDNPKNVKNAISIDKTILATTNNGYVNSLVTENLTDASSLSSSIFVTGNEKLDFAIDVVSGTASNNKMPLANATVKIIGVVNSTQTNLGIFNTNLKKDQEKQKEETNTQFGIFIPGKNNSSPPPKGGEKPTVNSKNEPKPAGDDKNAKNGTTFTLQALEPNLIASGRTDANGDFDIDFADLNFTGGNRFSHIKIVISKGSIEQTKTIPISALQNPDVDLGEVLCIASTYRFSPKVELPQISSTANDNKNIVVKIFREDAETITYPFLAHDGNLSPDKKIKQLINGKIMVLVAADSMKVKSAGQFKFAKLFEGINYTVQIGTSGNITKRTGGLKLAKVELSSMQVANIKPTYSLMAMPPSISGSVQLSLKTGFASVKDAIVRVEFNKDDVEEQPASNLPIVAGLSNQYSTKLVMGINATNTNLQIAKSVTQPLAVTKSSTASNFYTSGTANSIYKGGFSKSVIGDAIVSQSATNIQDLLIGPYTTKTDTAGNYTIGNLPKLKEGKTFTVKLMKVPEAFKNLQIEPSNTSIVSRVLDGEKKEVSFRIKPDLVQIVGRVVAEDKKALNNARLNFEGSTDFFTTGETGLFSTTYFPGKHYLIIKKEGYVAARIEVVVPQKTGGGGGNSSNGQLTPLPANILQKNHLFKTVDVFDDPRVQFSQNTQGNSIDLSIQLLNTPTIKNEIQKGNSFSPMLFGVASAQSAAAVNNSGIKSFSPIVPPSITKTPGTTVSFISSNSNSFSSNTKVTDVAAASAMSQVYNNALTNSNYGTNTLTTLDLGDVGFLKRKLGKIRFKILDAETNSAIAEAQIKLFDTVGIANNKGEWYYEGFGGEAKVTITAPTGSAYVMIEESLLINETGDEVAKIIKLQKGIKVSGYVRNNSSVIVGATIKVEEKPYLFGTTDNAGAYAFYIPKGNFQLKASKSGYIAKVEPIQANNSPIQLNFELADGGGKNIAKILGFDVELDQMIVEGNGYRVSGAFVNIKPALAELKTSINAKLQFSNVKINFDANNNAIPEGNKIITDELSLPFKLLNFIPVNLKSQTGFIVESDGNGGGKIMAEMLANMNAIQGSRGWGFVNTDVILLPDNISATTSITAFASTATATAQVNVKFKIKGPQASWQGNLYGFKFIAQTEQSYIDKDGLHFVGELHSPDLGPIKASIFKIEEFLVGTDLLIKRINISQNNLPAIKILDWSANIASLLFNEDGFKIGGNMVIKVPSSGTSNINFSDVSIGKDMMFGGKFVIPDNGINIFNIVSLKKGASPISFGQVPNQSGVYKLGGSGKIKFTKLITNEINIPIFEVHTNGRFLVDAPVNFETNLVFAKLKVQAIKFDNTGGTPLIGVQGAFSVDVPLLKLTAADISFKNNGGGVSVSVSKIKASLDVPVLKTEIEVDMSDNGFAGAGKLGIPGTPVNASIDFHYFKVNGGIDFGAKFSANVTIPIGFVTIERVGGGFQYNTASKDFMVDINGGLSIANLGAAVKLDPIGLTVRSGPVIEGYGSVVVGTTLNLANARMKLDFPQETFSVTVNSNIEPLKGVVSTKLQGDLVISLKKDDRFAFLGCAMETNLLGLIKSNGEFALGVGIKNPATRGDRVSYYFRNVDRKYVQDVFSGVYINTTAKMGVPKEKAIGFDFEFASASLYFSSEANAKLILNFAENNYLLGINGRFGGGFEFCAVGLCIGADYRACYEFMGGRNETDGWFIGGEAAGYVSLKVGGCNPDCNDWSIGFCGAGFRLCGEGGVKVNYAQRRGLGFSVFVGGNPLCR